MSNAQDRLANPKLLDIETKIAKAVADKTGNPLDPFYLLSPDQQKTVLLTQTLYPGDPQKTEITNQNDWFKPYYAAKNEYTVQMKDLGIFKTNPEYEDSKASSAELQQKLDFYGTLPKGTGARTAYLKQYPEVLQFFKDHEIKTNKEREALGLPPKAPYGSSSSESNWYTKYKYAKQTITNQSTSNKAKIKSVSAKLKKPKSKFKMTYLKSALKGIKTVKKYKPLSSMPKRKAIFPK